VIGDKRVLGFSGVAGGRDWRTGGYSTSLRNARVTIPQWLSRPTVLATEITPKCRAEMLYCDRRFLFRIHHSTHRGNTAHRPTHTAHPSGRASTSREWELAGMVVALGMIGYLASYVGTGIPKEEVHFLFCLCCPVLVSSYLSKLRPYPACAIPFRFPPGTALMQSCLLIVCLGLARFVDPTFWPHWTWQT
jgi:hypothetical protein